MSKYQKFIFSDYQFDASTKKLTLSYGFDDRLTLQETYEFTFPFVEYDATQLDRSIQNLFFMAGVSYFKAFVPPVIEIRAGQLDEQTAAFFSKTYQRGLGEFFYVNNLDPRTPVVFPTNSESLEPRTAHVQDGLLVGLGGGKDSLVSIELLRNEPRVATWSLNHHEQLQPLVERTGLEHLQVQRTIDPQLLELNKRDALNGHVPISAVFACVGTVVGILAGYATAVVSNEHSANEPTLHYQGVDINHQYSKSLEFEQDYQQLLSHHFDTSVQYFSFLRPLSELHIAELFAQVGFQKYRDVFSSCNRAFILDSHSMSWCGHCPKCAFVFLTLTPFIPREELEAIWDGKNLLLDPALDPMYRQLLGIKGDKPLECVGEVKESRAAMRLATQTYPELQKYQFELPEDYDYRALAPHSMPSHYYDVLLTAIQR